MRRLNIVLCLAFVLVACSRQHVSNIDHKSRSVAKTLTKEELRIVKQAREKIEERSRKIRGAFSKFDSKINNNNSDSTSFILNPFKTDIKIYNSAQEAYGQYQSSVYQPKFRAINCGTASDPSPTESILLGHDVYTGVTQEIVQVAQKITTPNEIAEFVKFNIKNELLFGSTRTATRTLRLRSGSVADKANLLVTLLRATGVPAYFVTGEVYLNESVAKRFFKVKDTSNLFYVIYTYFNNYFLNTNGAVTDIYKMIDGKPYWIMPHTWVRAYHDGTWHSYDPTQLDNTFASLGEEGSLTNSQTPDWQAWFFSPDTDGKYVKPRTFIDFLMQSYAPSRPMRFLNLQNSVGAEKRIDGVISEVAPCRIANLFGLEGSNLEYRASVVVRDTNGNVKLTHSAPLTLFTENLSYLSHSAGLLSEITTPTSGNIELRIGEQIVQSFSATTGTEYSISAALNGPVFWTSTSFSDQFAEKYKAADVFHFNMFAGPVGDVDLSLGIESLLEGIQADLDSRFIMARLLRLAGQLFQYKNDKYAKDEDRLRSFKMIPTTLTGTYSAGGGIATSGQAEKEFGLVPYSGGIDARLSGYVLSTESSIFNAEGLESLRIATEEQLVAGSEAEATIWEELFGIRGYSANRILQFGAQLKASGQNFNLINGMQFNASDNSPIADLLENGSVFKNDAWPSIDSIYGDLGGKFWALSKELTDPVGHAVAYGYFVFRKSIFENGIAAFKILNKGSLPFQGLADVDKNNDDYSGLALYSGKAESAAKIAAVNRDKVGIFGGGSGYVSETPQAPVDGESFNIGPSITGAASTGCGSPNPVDFSSGRMWHTMTDYNLQGRTAATRLKFERTYFTLPQYSSATSWVGLGDFGKGWVHTYDMRLLDGAKDTAGLLTMGVLGSSTQDVVWISPAGNPVLFHNTGSPSSPVFAVPEGFSGNLAVTSSTYVLTLKGNIKYTFKRDLTSNFNGRLLSIQEPHGETISVTYDSNGKLSQVSTGLAGSLVFTRDGNGRVVSVINPKNNLTYTYAYSNGRLISSTDFDGNTTRYEYNSGQVGTGAEGLLTAIEDPINRRIEFEYYQNGKVFKEKDHGGSVQTYQYAPYLNQMYTRVTSPNGFTTEYRYDDKFRVNQIVYPDGGRKFQTWNSQSRLESERDPFGFQTDYTYDSHGNITGIKKALDSGYRQIAYNQTFDIPVSMTPLAGSTTNFTLDSQTGDILQLDRTLNSSTIYRQFSYDSFGTVNSVSSNLNSYSNLTNSDGLTTFVFHNRNPQELSYDKRGRLIEKRLKNGRILRYSYDNYDRITHMEDTHGPVISNIYDNVGRLIRTTREGGGLKHTASFEYDDRDRVIASTNFAGERTEYKYDVVGVGCVIRDKPTLVISPEGKKTRFEYDFAGRKIREFLPNGDQISYSYNVRGDLIAVVDPKGLLTQFEYDENGRLAKTLGQSAAAQATTNGTNIGYGGEETSFIYDAADRLIRKEQRLLNESHVSGRYVTEYTHDALDRITQQRVFHKRGATVVEEFDNITYEYLSLLGEQKLSFVGNKYVDLRFNYQTQPPYDLIGYSVTPTAAGTLIGLKAKSFRVTPSMNGPMALIEREGDKLIKNGYDEAGRLLSVTGKLGTTSHSVSLGYDVFRRRNSISHSSGLEGTYGFDDVDRVVSIAWSGAGAAMNEALSYDREGLISQIVREIGTFNFGYSLNGEVASISYSGTEALNNAFVNTTLTHDAAGNIISYRGETFEPFNNFTTKVGTNTATYWPDYSGLGRMIGESRGSDAKSVSYYPDGKIRNFQFYSNSNLLRKVGYYYDGLGRRIAKVKDFTSEADSTITYTHLGLEDRVLLADVTKDGSMVETLYVDGQGIDDHLFEINGSNGAKGYIKDHLGSIINSSAIGGKSVYGLYGENLGSAPSMNSGTEPLIYGYTGRELDSESGYYNYRARVYDPVAARFLTKDPIGFGGGDTNLYRYVWNNPLNNVDPSGQSGVVGATAGFVSGGVGGYMTGGWMGAAVGGVVGAGVGFVAPWQSSYAGAAAAGFVASVVGQGLGNAVSGNPVTNIDPVVALASGLGGASGLELATGLGLGLYGGAVLSGVGSGVSEYGASYVSPGPTNWSNAYNSFYGTQQNSCGGH